MAPYVSGIKSSIPKFLLNIIVVTNNKVNLRIFFQNLNSTRISLTQGGLALKAWLQWKINNDLAALEHMFPLYAG